MAPFDTKVRFSSEVSTTLNPRASVQNSSSTEMSKDSEVTASQMPGAVPIRSSMPAKKLLTLRCSIITPLGRPVEPEV